jgi:hypothetical protein
MTIEPFYNFVLWAIPRFHRTSAVKNGCHPYHIRQPEQRADNATSYAAPDPASARHRGNAETAACLPTHL